MLASNKKRARSVNLSLGSFKLMSRPEGNDRYVRNAPKNPKETRWMYDDDVSPLSRNAAIQAYEIDCIRAWGFGS
jgi:hypothetical protein